MKEFEYMPVTKLPSGLMIPEDSASLEDILYKDQEYLKQMYPAKSRMILALVEDRCDRMEYEGSPLFADYPDKETFLRVARDIYRMVSGCKNCNEEKEKDIALRQLIEILVLNECSMRRGRYKRRRRFF